MKKLALVLTLLSNAPLTALAGHAVSEPLNNCYQGGSAQFFASELEDISQSKKTPVLLLSASKQVVGVLTVTPERATKYPHKAKSVTVNKLSLCSSLEVDEFYYADDDLLDWVSNSVHITQDEGLIVLNSSVEKREEYATLVKVDFMAYDVFTEEEEVAKQEGQPDFIEDWGTPKGRGTFYFYIPKTWTEK